MAKSIFPECSSFWQVKKNVIPFTELGKVEDEISRTVGRMSKSSGGDRSRRREEPWYILPS